MVKVCLALDSPSNRRENDCVGLCMFKRNFILFLSLSCTPSARKWNIPGYTTPQNTVVVIVTIPGNVPGREDNVCGLGRDSFLEFWLACAANKFDPLMTSRHKVFIFWGIVSPITAWIRSTFWVQIAYEHSCRSVPFQLPTFFP